MLANGPASVQVGGAVHGQAGHAVQEVGQCEVDDEDGGVLEGGDVEPEHLVVLRPGDSTEGEKVAGRSHNGDDDTARIVMRDSHSLVVLRHPRHCGDAPGEGVVRLLQAAGVHCIFLVGRSRQHYREIYQVRVIRHYWKTNRAITDRKLMKRGNNTIHNTTLTGLLNCTFL